MFLLTMEVELFLDTVRTVTAIILLLVSQHRSGIVQWGEFIYERKEVTNEVSV